MSKATGGAPHSDFKKKLGKQKGTKGKVSNPAKTVSISQLLHFFSGPTVDVRAVVDRIKKVLYFHQNDRPYTFESFGLVHYVNKDGLKVDGVLENKRPDMRVVEINLSGEEAKSASYEVPVHELQKIAHEELEIVKNEWISVEKLKEALDFVKGDKFATETLSIDLPEGITELNQSTLCAVMQLLTGIAAAIFVEKDQLKIRKFVNGRDKRQQTWLWPKRYVTFSLQRNMRLSSVVEGAARRLGLNFQADIYRSNFECGVGYCHQFLQVDRVEPELIRDAFEKESCNVANFTFSDEQIKKNAFRGFRYMFSIRAFKNSPEDTKLLMENFQKSGYINYFNVYPSTLNRMTVTDVGKNLIKNDYMAAAKLLIRPRPVDLSTFEEIKELLFVAQDVHIIAPFIRQRINMKDNNGLMARILNIMLKDPQGRITPKNSEAMFQKVGSNQIADYTDLFLHSIWNDTVNLLIEKRGLKLAVGDLVFVDEAAESKILYERRFGATVSKEIVQEEGDLLKEVVKALTQEDLDAGKYSIQDLVVPVCGFNVKWPENDVSEYINTVLKKHAIDDKSWFEQKVKGQNNILPVTFPGTYRKVISIPQDLKWQIVEYKDPRNPLILSDVSRNPTKIVETNNEEIEVEKKEESEESHDEEVDAEAKGTKQKKNKKPAKVDDKLEPQNALVVEFFLPKGTNLMTPLRELFKKNNFGELASPFYERLVDPKSIDAFRRKLEQLQTALVEKFRANVQSSNQFGQSFGNMGGSLMATPYPYRVAPPQPYPDPTMMRIQMLERELALMRLERNQLYMQNANFGRDNRAQFYENRFDFDNLPNGHHSSLKRMSADFGRSNRFQPPMGNSSKGARGGSFF